jgi:hypothetical protein
MIARGGIIDVGTFTGCHMAAARASGSPDYDRMVSGIRSSATNTGGGSGQLTETPLRLTRAEVRKRKPRGIFELSN